MNARRLWLLLGIAWLVGAVSVVAHVEGAGEQPPSPLDEELLESLGSDPLDPVDGKPVESGPPSPAEEGDASRGEEEEWQQRLRRELGAAAESEEDNPLLEIARMMRQAEGRLDRHDAGSATQGLQRRIVADLNKLIEEARKAAKKSGAPASAAQRVASRAPVGQPPNRGAQPQGGQPSDKPAAQSNQRPRAAGEQPGQADLERVRAIIKDLWGELPERQREQMLESPPEEFLPKYELLIEEYFRRLSEEKTP